MPFLCGRNGQRSNRYGQRHRENSGAETRPQFFHSKYCPVSFPPASTNTTGTGTCGVGGWTHGFLGSMIDRSIWCHLPTHSNLLHHVWGRFNAPNRSNPSSIFWIRLAPYQNRFFLEKTRVSRCWRPYAFATAAMSDFFLSRLPAVEPFTTNISCVYTDNINENSCEKWYHGEGGGLPRLKQKGIPSVEI